MRPFPGFRLGLLLSALAATGGAAAASEPPPRLLPSTTEAPQEFGPGSSQTTVSALVFFPGFSDEPYNTSGSLGRFGEVNRDEHFYAQLDLPFGAVIDFIALNNFNDGTPNVILLTLAFRNENGALGTIATIGNTGHASWSTDFSATPLNYLYDFALPLILDVEITSSASMQFFGNVRVGWHRSVSTPPVSAYFGDVPMNHPFFQFISALYYSGITGGCQTSPPLYCPVTRGQMAVFLAKALGLNWTGD